MDSAISTSSSHGVKGSQDLGASPADVAKVIAAAGSADAALTQLLKDRITMKKENAQLWRLVEKQRTMMLGLNKDLERAYKDRDRYRKKLKEHLAQEPPMTSVPGQGDGMEDGAFTEGIANEKSAEDNPAARRAASNVVPLSHGNLGDFLQGSTTPTEPPPDITNLQKERSVPHVSARSEAQTKSAPSAKNRDMTIDVEKSERIGPRLKPLGSAQSAKGGSASSPKSFAAARAATSHHANSSISSQLSGAVPSPPPRKPPPAPLNLPSSAKSPPPPSSAKPALEDSDSEYDVDEVAEIPESSFERGRRKTREEDDRLRELALLREQEARSRSKKEKKSKSKSATPKSKDVTPVELQSLPVELPVKKHAVPIAPPANLGKLGPEVSLASVLSKSSKANPMTAQRFIDAPQMSPGLPMSPRPGDRALNSPMPRMPKQGINISNLASPPLSPPSKLHPGGGPLSPRGPQQPFPLPPNTPMSMASPGMYRPEVPPPSNQNLGHDLPNILNAQFRPIYQGLKSDQYPDLLLPPNALPSVAVKVSSSRLKPSRASFIAGRPKPAEEENVFTLGVYARSDKKELWRVEKDIMSLPQLDQQLRQVANLSAKLPERNLFNGHAPAKIDARRAALDQYFDAILETHLDEKAALYVCHFLSTDAIEPQVEFAGGAVESVSEDTSSSIRQSSKRTKEGYLTKKGKNFGGWKARYFYLDGPLLRYYEGQGGPHLGTIKLQNAQIGRVSDQMANGSPPRPGDDLDDQFRHAFLILEPKRKDSNSLVRHVLCAENDAERDEWVDALVQYIDYHSSEEEDSPSSVKPHHREASKSNGLSNLKLFGRKGSKDLDSPRSPKPEAESLRGLSYDEAVQAEAPKTGGITSAKRNEETPSPPAISGPTNGAKIEDAEAWGNKTPLEKKDHKKRGLWGLRGRPSSEMHVQSAGGSQSSLGQSTNSERPGPVLAVFGAPLGEASEHCRPYGVDTYLPAVVYRSIEYLEAKNASSEEGIFRLSGSNTLIKSLRERFNTEGDVNLVAEDHYTDVHAVASLLKLYLRELPSTILTRELHLDFLHVLELSDRDTKLATLNTLVHRLPKANWWLLRALSAFLLSIINNSNVNKMTDRNVGIVFSPTLNIPQPVFSLFLTDFSSIFGQDPDDFIPSPDADVSPTPSPLTPEDIRSPRKQMFQELPTPMLPPTPMNFPTSPRYIPKEGLLQSPSPYQTGFIPLQPSYKQPGGYVRQAPITQVSSNGPEYGSLNGALAPPTEQQPMSKAKRRESSMLMLALGGQRKGGMPQLAEGQGKRSPDVTSSTLNIY